MLPKMKTQLRVQPGELCLGSNYVGAKIEGTIGVFGAPSSLAVSSLECATGGACSIKPLPNWIELQGPTKAPALLTWKFRIHTDKPGPLFATLVFHGDEAIGDCQVSLIIKRDKPLQGDVILCGSPLSHYTHHESLRSLIRILTSLPLRIHFIDSLRTFNWQETKVVILHQSGLLQCRPTDLEAIQSLVKAGTNLVILADEFFRGTTNAANLVLAPFGLQMMQDGSEAVGIAVHERNRRILEWQSRYEVAHSGMTEICPHRLTKGLKRIYWFRPCPVACTGAGSMPLIKNSANGSEYFAAVSESNGCVIAVGTSLWSSLSSLGWPYDNDRFLANLLVGGDAESMLSENISVNTKETRINGR